MNDVTTNISAHVPDGISEINGNLYMGDGKGGFQPVEGIQPQHKLEDQTVRNIVEHAIELSNQVTRFKAHTFNDIAAHAEILAEKYNATLGGPAGNMTLKTVDGLFKVIVQVADHIDFGPELQTAKKLLDECLNEWSADARAELRGIVTDAFNTDNAGQINRSLIANLLRRESDDPRWNHAMKAIRDAQHVVGSKQYVRFYKRDSHDAGWDAVTIDMAAA